jgi:nucleoside 2-deoxyribosyltransferase
MRLYFAGPLFSAAERDWNEELAAALRKGGHEVFLPQDQETGMDAARVFNTDVGGIDWADALVAIMDGPDPDAGTAWEVGYAYGKKPIVLVRTDFRAGAGSSGPDGGGNHPARPALRAMARIVAEVLDALRRAEEGSR